MIPALPDRATWRIKLFADGADQATMLSLAREKKVQGFTTNPTLMRQAGVSDYRAFSKALLAEIKDVPISFEVFADELDEMGRQAKEIASWGKNVNVKIPVTNTKGISTAPLVEKLAKEKVSMNVTGVFSLAQVATVAKALAGGPPSICSVFAGRIADTGRDPVPHMKAAVALCAGIDPKIEVLWASPREALNVVHAEEAGCHIITVQPDLLKKVAGFGKGLEQFSLETVQMFRRDAEAAGYVL